jgi:hypothetical protein
MVDKLVPKANLLELLEIVSKNLDRLKQELYKGLLVLAIAILKVSNNLI